jgi:hypothetical protein
MKITNIRILLFLLGLFFFLPLAKAQNNQLRQLLGKKTLNCPSIYDSLRKEIWQTNAPLRQTAVPELLSFWYSYCDPTEEMIRLKILSEIASKQPLPKASELQDFYHAYINRLHFAGNAVKDSLLLFSQQWAQDLENRRQTNRTTAFTLQLLQAKSYKKALKVIYRKEYFSLSGNKELRQKNNLTNKSLNLQLGLLANQYTGSLNTFINTAPSFLIGATRSFNTKNAVGMYFSVTPLNFKQNMLIYAFDSLNQTQGDYSLSFGFQYSHTLWQSNRLAWHLNSWAGFSALDTGLEQEVIRDDQETVEPITIGTYDVAGGMEWRFRFYTYHQIGLQLNYHFTNFLLGSKARSNLAGNVLSYGLVFYW